jgi:signal transduction histidine kinase/DNA-binding response OmpR family regulator/PAS domain-containing protein/CHASE3 domain sensor protein
VKGAHPTGFWIGNMLGAGALALGLLVLVGWYSHSVTLIQVLPAFVPMQYNTALGFAVCGAGVLSIVNERRSLALSFGAFGFLLGFLTLVEYVFAVDLQIDQLAMEHYITVETSHPGRMAPNTALCFTLTGLGITTLALPRARAGTALLLGILILVLGLIALGGYVIGIETAYGFGNLTRMAVHTVFGFALLGPALFVIASVSSHWIMGSVGTKAVLALTVLVGLFVVWATFSYLLNAKVRESTRALSERREPAATSTHQMLSALSEMNGALFKYVLGDVGQKDVFPSGYRRFIEHASRLRTVLTDKDETLDHIEAMFEDYHAAARAGVLTAYNPATTSAARRRLDDIRKRDVARIEATIDKLDLSSANLVGTSGASPKIVRIELKDEIDDMLARLVAYTAGHSSARFGYNTDSNEFRIYLKDIEQRLGAPHEPLRSAFLQFDEKANALFAAFDPAARVLAIGNAVRLEAETYLELSELLIVLDADIRSRTLQTIVELENQAQRNQNLLAVFFVAVVLLAGTIVGLAFSTLVHPIRRLNSRMLALAEGDTDFEIPMRIREDEVGQMARAVQVFKENAISRAVVEAELGEAELRLRTAVDNLSSSILMVDADLNVQLVNRQHLAMYEMDESIISRGSNLEAAITFRAERGDFGPGAVADVVEERLANYRDESAVYGEDHVPGGRVMDVVRASMSDGGQVILATEVTDRKAAEDALRNKNQLVELLHQTTAESNAARTVGEVLERCLGHLAAYMGWPLGHAWVVSDDTDGRLHSSGIWYVAPGHDYSSFQTVTRGLSFGPGDGLPGTVLATQLPTWMARGDRLKLELPRARVAKECGLISSFGTPVISAGKVVAVLELLGPKDVDSKEEISQVLEHISTQIGRVFERVEAEKTIVEARDAAEAAGRAKASFLATMSHEIRTPLNGVIGMVDLLSQSKLDGDQNRMLRTIRDSGYALLTIINDILNFSKIDANMLELEAIPMSVAECVEGAAATLAPAAGRKDIEIISYVDPRLREMMRGDPVRVRQILFNLGGNAIKFSPPGSIVIIRADREGGDTLGQCTVVLRVIDRGMGISEEGQTRLFKAFSQVEASTTRKFGGTGLGLSICHRLVELMDGEIGVSSEEGRGAEFFVRIPFENSNTARAPSVDVGLSDLNVIVVSRHPVRVESCRDDLISWGAKVETASTFVGLQERIEMRRTTGNGFDVVVLADAANGAENEEFREYYLDPLQYYPRFVVACNPASSEDAVQTLREVTLVEANPIRHDALVNAVAIAAGCASPFVNMSLAAANLKAHPPPSIAQALADNSLILVAEDNLTNQDVIRRQLAMLGYQCEIANDGREALQMWFARPYAILLTDCHMPEMDGFELTESIRKRESGGDARAPIVAITANALQGEAERCLASGMDGYLSKPLEMQALRRALRRWMGPLATPVPATDAPQMGSSIEANACAIDAQALRSVFGDDDETFREILDDFIGPASDNVAQVSAAREARDAPAVEAASHKLKSSARSVGAVAVADLCDALESAGAAVDWDTIDANASAGQLEKLMEEVVDYIRAL